jgi:hypothetical protein
MSLYISTFYERLPLLRQERVGVRVKKFNFPLPFIPSRQGRGDFKISLSF